MPEHPGPPGLAALHQGLACRVWQVAALPYTGMNPFFRGRKKVSAESLTEETGLDEDLHSTFKES